MLEEREEIDKGVETLLQAVGKQTITLWKKKPTQKTKRLITVTTVKEAKLVSILVFISHEDGCQDSLRAQQTSLQRWKWGRRDRKTRNIYRSLQYCSTVGALWYSPCLFEALCETLGHARFKYDLGAGLLPLVGEKKDAMSSDTPRRERRKRRRQGEIKRGGASGRLERRREDLRVLEKKGGIKREKKKVERER